MDAHISVSHGLATDGSHCQAIEHGQWSATLVIDAMSGKRRNAQANVVE